MVVEWDLLESNGPTTVRTVPGAIRTPPPVCLPRTFVPLVRLHLAEARRPKRHAVRPVPHSASCALEAEGTATAQQASSGEAVRVAV